MTRLQLESVGKSFGSHRALDAIDLDIASGEMIALLGPSGCGKTTLLRAIAGLEDTSSGRILFDGKDITNLSIQKRNTGMVFQRYALFPHMSVENNIRFGLKVRDMPKAEQDARLEEILDTVQLGDFRHRFPAQLSGGQMQRVALARTLVTRPSILMLDEPFANLDTNLRGEMRDFIKQLQAQFNITTIFVTHDQSEAMDIADRIAVIFDGCVAQFDTPNQLYTAPRNIQTAKFMGEANILTGTMANNGLLTTSIGHLEAPTTNRPAPGKEVQLMIRDESIQLHQSEPDKTAISATIRTSRFFGARTDYQLRLGNHTLNASEQSRRNLAPGSPIWITIQPRDIWIFPT